MGDERQAREERFTLLYDAHSSAIRAYACSASPSG